MQIQVGQQQMNKRDLPLILLPLTQRAEESDKSLFNNNSVSSEQMQKEAEWKPMKIEVQPKFPEVDQIRKFLKRGDQINTTTLKRLKEDKQINNLIKLDRSSTSLYKSVRNIQYPMNEDERQAQIKRLYLSHKRQPSKLNFRTALYKFNKTSQEVQTEDQINIQAQPSEAHPNVPVYSLHKPSFMTIDVMQQEAPDQRKGAKDDTLIEPDQEQNKLLPLRGKRGTLARVKALSTSTNQNASNINSYLKAMAKLDYSFHTTMNKFTQRYKEYAEQETIFSKTIEVKPLKPLNQTLSNLGQGQSQFKTQPTTALFEKNDSRATHQLPTGLNISSVTPKDSLPPVDFKPESRVQKKIDQKSQTNQRHNVVSTIQEATNQKDSSMLPQLSRQAYSNSYSKDDGRKTSRMISRIAPFLATSAEESHSGKNKHMKKIEEQSPKKSELIQVPSIPQLKIGEVESSTQKIVHPIRQNFGNSQVQWIHSKYNPKSDIFKNFSMSNFHIKKYQNGVYFGELSPEGKKHGKGVIFYFSGKIYEGNFFNDLKNGLGNEYFPDGSSYKGEFKQGVRHGRGVFEWSNGQIYDGQWDRGRKNGSGMWKSPEGESYIGQWKRDKVQGFGVFVMKNSSRYEGQFKNSLKHGTGTERFNSGQTYVGSYERNRPNGDGEYYWANGDYYKGNFSNGLRHRQGYFRQGKTGIEYRGQYHNDKKCGFGEINYGKGLEYRGNFQNNFRHGYGQLFENGQVKYRGYWVNDHQIDDENHLPLAQDEVSFRSVSKKEEDKPQQEKKLPKANIRAPQREKRTQRVKPNSVSPNVEVDDGYMRACRCKRKH